MRGKVSYTISILCEISTNIVGIPQTHYLAIYLVEALYMYTHTTYVHTTYIHTCTHTHNIHMYMYTHTPHMYTQHTYVHVHTTYIRTCTHTHTHTHDSLYYISIVHMQ